MTYIPLVVKSTYSLRRSTSKPWQIAQRLRLIGASNAVLMDDSSSLACCVKIIKAFKDACSSCGYPKNSHSDGGKGACTIKDVSCGGYGVKPIRHLLGSTFNLLDKPGHVHVVAKNLTGWKALVKASSDSNRPERYNVNGVAAIGLANLAGQNYVAFAGALGSYLGNACFKDVNAAYLSRDYATAKTLVKDWPSLKGELASLAGEAIALFGRDNFFLQVQLVDKDVIPANAVLANIMRWLAKEAGLKCVATPCAYYPSKEDAPDQRVMLCADMNTSLGAAEQSLNTPQYASLARFFHSNSYHIPSHEEMAVLHAPEELANTILIGELCEPYDIFHTPYFPVFTCPDGQTPEDRMKAICREGWKKRGIAKLDKPTQLVYTERVKRELEILIEAQLASYFLIEHDVFNYAKTVLKTKIRPRGSAEGSLVLYLMGITTCDPIADGLMFERFYSAARNIPAHVSFPEIDFDKFNI